MLKHIASGLVLALALTGAACKKDEAKPAADKKTAEPAKTPEPVASPEPTKADPAGGAGKALEGMDKHAFTAGGSLDGVANFGFGGGGDSKAACEQYGKDVGQFLTDLQTEYKMLEDTMDSKGADALDRFGRFLVKGADNLKGVKVDNGDLKGAHTEFTSGIETMGQGFVDAAGAVRAGDEGATNKALEKVQAGANGVKASFGKLTQICGG